MNFNLILIKFLNIFRFLIYFVLDFLISLRKQTINSNTLLLIRLDSIGDYLLLRNYFQFIRNSDKYKNYEITLIGNKIWKELAVTFDEDLINNFIWLDRKKFNNNVLYKYRLLKRIYDSGFESVIDCTYSREILFGDSIVKVSRALNKIGFVGSPDSYVKWKRNLFTDRIYTLLIPTEEKIIFEFERNKDYFSKVLEQKIEIKKPQLNINKVKSVFESVNNFIVIFPGANHKKRRWSVKKFVKVVNHIIEKHKFDIVIAGSSEDSILADQILLQSDSNRVKIFAGKTSLPELAKLISDAILLISNDTSAIHFAASVNTPFICISNGNHFGRFHPYPKEMGVEGIFIYPTEIMSHITDYDYLKSKYGFGSELDINLIDEQVVISAAEKFLTKE